MVKKSEKEKATLEIEFIDKSKEIDKFDYDVGLKTMLAVYTADTALFIVGLNQKILSLWIIAGVLFLVIPFFFRIFLFAPIQREFKKKRKIERERYKILGINPADLDEELRKTNPS